MRKEQFQKVLQERIEQLCKERDMSYYKLSYKSTIPMTTLIHIVEGTTENPGAFTIMKICEGLGISLKEFYDTKEFEDVIGESD